MLKRAKKRKRGELFDQKDVFLCVKLCFLCWGILGTFVFGVKMGVGALAATKKRTFFNKMAHFLNKKRRN